MYIHCTVSVHTVYGRNITHSLKVIFPDVKAIANFLILGDISYTYAKRMFLHTTKDKKFSKRAAPTKHFCGKLQRITATDKRAPHSQRPVSLNR